MSPKKTTKDSKFGTGGNFKSKEFIEDSSSEDEGGDKKLKVNIVCQIVCFIRSQLIRMHTVYIHRN